MSDSYDCNVPGNSSVALSLQSQQSCSYHENDTCTHAYNKCYVVNYKSLSSVIRKVFVWPLFFFFLTVSVGVAMESQVPLL